MYCDNCKYPNLTDWCGSPFIMIHFRLYWHTLEGLIAEIQNHIKYNVPDYHHKTLEKS